MKYRFMKRNNSTYFLGTGITKSMKVRFLNKEDNKPIEIEWINKPIKKERELITKKLLIIFGIIAIVKITVLMLWI